MSTAQGGRPIVYLIARRELEKRLSGRVFRLGTIAIIALVAIGVVVAKAAGSSGTPPAVRIGFTPTTATLEPAFTGWTGSLAISTTVSEVADDATGLAQVQAGTLDVAVTGSPTAPVAHVKDTLESEVQSALEVAVLEARLSAAGLAPSAVTAALTGTHVTVQSLATPTPDDPERPGKLAAAVFVAFLLYLSLALYGSFVAQGVVEEKATRIVEILLGTVRPSQLLTGKILGIGAAGLLQLFIIGAVTFAMIQASHLIAIPSVGLGSILGYLLWFVLGFLLYATAYASVASLVSRQEDVSTAVAPIYIFLVAAYVLVAVVVNDPGSTVAAVVSVLPPFAPILMSVRMATGDATAWQVVLAIVLTIATIVGLTRLAGRIYANSILRLGARVRLRDAIRDR